MCGSRRVGRLIGTSLAGVLILGPAVSLGDGAREQSHSLSDWIGDWASGDEKTIRVSAGSAPDELLIEASATFGANDPERIVLGAVHSGEFSVRLPENQIVDGSKIAFTVGEDGVLPFSEGTGCRVRMRLNGAEMRVEDDGQCGGLNVTFTGQYIRIE